MGGCWRISGTQIKKAVDWSTPPASPDGPLTVPPFLTPSYHYNFYQHGLHPPTFLFLPIYSYTIQEGFTLHQRTWHQCPATPPRLRICRQRRIVDSDSSHNYPAPSAGVGSKLSHLSILRHANFSRLKCDRTMPCQNCVKRSLASSCTYIHAALVRDKAQIQKTIQAPKDVQTQVRRLEELVISLMHKTNKGVLPSRGQDHVTPDPSPTSSEHLADSIEEKCQTNNAPRSQLKDTALSLGRITIGEDHRANYVGSAHWSAILDNVDSTSLQV